MKTFELSNIQDQTILHSLSKTLNDNINVHHIKVMKNRIHFEVSDILVLQSELSQYKGITIKEVVDGNKRLFKFPQNKNTKRYFLIKNEVDASHINRFLELLSQDDRFSNIEYNYNNRLLTLTTKERNILPVIRTYLFSVDPIITIKELKRNKLPRDYFSHKFMRIYFQLGIVICALSIALITRNDDSIMPYIMWFISIYTIGFTIVQNAFEAFKKKYFFDSNVLMCIALLFCFVSGRYIEAIISIFVYHLVPNIDNFVYEIINSRIDNMIEIPKTGIKVKNGREEEISLYDFVRGDTMKVLPGETILIPGLIIDGESTISSFMNDSHVEEKEVSTLHQVYDGDINTGDSPIYVLIDRPYEATIYETLQNLAIHAPSDESKIQKHVYRISSLIKPVIFLLGISLGVILPILNYHDYSSYIHVAGIIMIIAYQYPSEQATIFSTLFTLAKSFNKGIIVESANAYNKLATSQTIVYDRVDNVPMNKHEWLLFKNLSHLGKHFVIFNDGPEDLEHPNYEIYNNLTVEEKINKMESLYSPLAYIGDSSKDLELIEMSDIGISRGGLSDHKLVENSDIVLVDSMFKRVYQMFTFSRRLRSKIIIYNIIDLLMKVIFLIGVIAFPYTPLYLFIIIQLLFTLLITLTSII